MACSFMLIFITLEKKTTLFRAVQCGYMDGSNIALVYVRIASCYYYHYYYCCWLHNCVARLSCLLVSWCIIIYEFAGAELQPEQMSVHIVSLFFPPVRFLLLFLQSSVTSSTKLYCFAKPEDAVLRASLRYCISYICVLI